MHRLSTRSKLYPQQNIIDEPVELNLDCLEDHGNFADVYKVNLQGKPTCLKVLRVYKNAVENVQKECAKEAIIWGQLCHPNVLPFHGLHMHCSRIALVAPWAENGNLKEYLDKTPEAKRILLCLDTVKGLNYLHDYGIVHGDLKSRNVLVDGSGRACLGDFGLSGITDKNIGQWTTQSSAGSKGGTVRWQAPELHNSEVDVIHNTKESDIYAWASTCYEIFTSHIPFYEVTNLDRVKMKISQGDIPTRPDDQDSVWSERGLTEGIWDLLVDCWRKEPDKRPNITMVTSRLNDKSPNEDPRPPPQWETGIARQFRNDQEALSSEKRPSIEDLDPILLRILSDPTDSRCA